MAFNELYYRYEEFANKYKELDKRENERKARKKARKYQLKVFDMAGKVLGFKKVLEHDYEVGQDVMSHQFRDKIEHYQKTRGLRVTGKLDYHTLKAMSDKKLATMLFHHHNDR